MEATLQRVYGVDLRDLWRPGRDLTLRRVFVLIDQLPAEWDLHAHLLDEVRRTIVATTPGVEKVPPPWPGRFRRKAPDRERQRKLADARRRARQHRARKEAT